MSSLATRAIAQGDDRGWIEVSPAGESFQVSMPNQPRVEIENAGALSGNRYFVPTAYATYTIWSVTNAHYRSDEDTDAYLDTTAELIWEGLLKSAREQLDEKARQLARMTYERELPPEGLPGREYSLTVGSQTGTIEFFVAHEHIYVMLLMGTAERVWSRERFFSSFRVPLPAPVATPATPLVNGSVGPADASDSDPNHIFTGREVTAKVRILEKQEPTYTETARKFGVQGTVVLRAVFSKNGEVTNIHVVRKLPHGMTQRAVSAARNIRFTPATKDGQPVSMWMELQYNFNLF